MSIIRTAIISMVMVLLSAPLIYGQDLSKYRNFSLGMTVTDLSKQIDAKSTDVTVVHEHPVLIQELTWWPPLSGYAAQADSVRQVLFSFYDGKLYRMFVTYDDDATQGLTAEDMARAISLQYGIATASNATIDFPTGDYATTEKAIDRWDDSQYSVNLFRSSRSNTFALVMFTKLLDAKAEAAIAQAEKLEQQEAPQKELARVKKETDDLETTRQNNIKTFRP